MSSLFGIVSEDDPEKINRNIKNLAENQEQIIHDLDMSLSIYSTDIVFLCNENAYQTVAKHPPNFAFCQRSNTVFRISQSDERFLKP